MSVEGRISVDVLFHDKDGTNAINVLSLSSSAQYTDGVVASVTRTVSAGTQQIPTDQYRDAAGNLVGISPTIMAFVHSADCIISQTDDVGGYSLRVSVQPGKTIVIPVQAEYGIAVQSLAGGTYTAILYSP